MGRRRSAVGRRVGPGSATSADCPGASTSTSTSTAEPARDRTCIGGELELGDGVGGPEQRHRLRVDSFQVAPALRPVPRVGCRHPLSRHPVERGETTIDDRVEDRPPQNLGVRIPPVDDLVGRGACTSGLDRLGTATEHRCERGVGAGHLHVSVRVAPHRRRPLGIATHLEHRSSTGSTKGAIAASIAASEAETARGSPGGP